MSRSSFGRIASLGKKSELNGSGSFSGGDFLVQVGTGEQCGDIRSEGKSSCVFKIGE